MDEHGSDKTETLFVGFAWCTNANQGTYRAVIDYLKTRAPQLINSIETIYTDFEQAAILAYYYELPNAKIHGCYFHYTQCVTKHFDDVKLSHSTSTNPDSNEKSKRKKPPKKILFVARVLPLLPPDDLEEGLQVLANLIDEHIGKWPDLQTFKDYIYKQWAGKAKLLSCFREPIRTNDKSEAFNRTLLTRFGGKHPTLGTFLYNMCGIIFAEKSNAYRQIQSHRETKIQQNYNKNMKIKNIEDALKKKLIKVEYFLYQVMSDENLEIISRKRRYRAEELYNDENKINERKKGQDDLQTLKNKGKPITVPEQYEPDYGTKKKSKKKLSKSPIQSNTYRYAGEIIDENMNHDTLIESSKLNAKPKPTKKKNTQPKTYIKINN